MIIVSVIQIGTLNSNQDSNSFIDVYVVVTIICKCIEETYFFDFLEHTKIFESCHIDMHSTINLIIISRY